MIHVIDSLMGTGKTKWAINYMNSSDRKFIYVAPFLTECDRIQHECPLKQFMQPDQLPSKQINFKWLISNGCNTVITHELFKQLKLSIDEIRRIDKWKYELIIDEVVETIHPIPGMNIADFNVLQDCFSLSPNGKVTWKNSDPDKHWPQKYSELREIANTGNLISVNKAFFWKLPIDFIELFENVYVMTYNFEHSHLAYDLQIASSEYEICHIENNELKPGRQDTSVYKQWFRDHVDIYEGKTNRIGDELNALSATHFKRMSDANKVALIGKIRSYFTNVPGVSARRCMYSRYKLPGELNTRDNLMPVKSFHKAAFVPFNTTATNAFRDRDILCYAVNVYEHPNIVSYYSKQDVSLSQDGKALNTMLQWIFRSDVRNFADRTEPVRLAVFSSRMRQLLRDWLSE